MTDRSLKVLTSECVSLLPQIFDRWEAPRIFLQCGSGFSTDALFDEPPQSAELNSLPGMPHLMTPDKSHPMLLFGHVNGMPVLATHGHRHLYEGYGILPCILPVCVASAAGCGVVILIDSGLSLMKDIKVGSWMLLTDFINGHNCSPLDGNHNMLDNAFPDMTNALSQHLNSELMNALDSIGICPKLGVFMSRPGSQFCTVSEANFARLCGADIVGHDLVMEIITAHALGCKVSAFALAALNAPTYYSNPLSRADLVETCQFCSRDIMRGIRKGITSFFED